MGPFIFKALDSVFSGNPYQLKSIISRVILVTIIAIIALQIISYISLDVQHLGAKTIPLRYYFLVIIMFNLLSEIQIVIDNILERILPDPKSARRRLGIQTFSGLILLIFLFFISKSVFAESVTADGSRVGVYIGLLMGLIFVGSVSNTLMHGRLTEKWINSQREIDIIKQEKLKMDYNSLQDQLNPHFLFNNLSVLKSLIIYDQDTALKFTENFTDVYRYVLQSKDKVVASLADELEFIEAFLGLHKERLGEGLNVKLSIDKEEMNKEIAPLTLQLLIENAIKHNICSKEQPLSIEIIIKDNYLAVINNIQKKESTYSTKTGLNNLIERYKMLTNEEIRVLSDNNEFMVQVPLV